MGIEVTGGGLYVLGPDNKYSPIEKIVDCNTECTDLGELDYLPLAIDNLSASFTCTARLSTDALIAFFGFSKAMIAACPNKRVAWLATHAKKKRTRTKNFNRVYRILEED